MTSSEGRRKIKKQPVEHLTVGKYVEITSSSTFLSQEWKERGACVAAVEDGVDAMTWFPESKTYVPEKAAESCNRCPVRLQCLVWAIYANEPQGIWGGQPIQNIKKVRRKLQLALRQGYPRARS